MPRTLLGIHTQHNGSCSLANSPFTHEHATMLTKQKKARQRSAGLLLLLIKQIALTEKVLDTSGYLLNRQVLEHAG